jgi:hypothetical protein
MDNGEFLATLLIQISTVVGVLVSIWWPRKVEAGSVRARAFRSLRLAATCLVASYLLLLAALGLPPVGDTALQRVLLAAMLGTVPLTPLSSAALAIERGRRVRALFSCYGALLFAAALAWICAISALTLLGQEAPLWRLACLAAAAGSCGAGVVLIMELYALLRRPPAV